MECIILAGGLGTRLQGVIGAQPKCMAPVAGKPFLHYLFTYLEEQGCTRVVLSLGYLHNVVEDWLEDQRWPFTIRTVIEETPLGTGGGIRLAMQEAQQEHVFILNGDTFFNLDLRPQMHLHLSKRAAATLALKPMKSFERYGTVQTDANARITSFEEKKPMAEGLINGGVYLINRAAFLAKDLPEAFSFEKDYLEAFVGDGAFYGYLSSAYFIDIGVPDDYHRAGVDFKKMFP